MKFLEHFRSQKTEENFDVLPDGIFVLNQEGQVIDCNDKVLKILKLKKFEILGRFFSDFIENGTNALNKVLQTQQAQNVKTNCLDDEFPMEFELTVSRNIETQKVYACIRNATQIIKEQKIINEKYQVAQKIIEGKNDFLLTSSGAILSSLVSIGGFSRALLDGIGGALSEKQEKYLKIINNNSRDLVYDLEKLFALFRVESSKINYQNKAFDMVSLIKSIDRIYKKDFEDKKIIFNLDYSNLTQRDCFLDAEIVEYILRCIMDIFLRFSNLGKCSLNIGHPPLDFLKTREFAANNSYECEKYILFEAKITDLIFTQNELDNIFDTYAKTDAKRPIGLRASLNLLKRYIVDFKGDIWIYSKQNFGTMFTFVLPLR